MDIVFNSALSNEYNNYNYQLVVFKNTTSPTSCLIQRLMNIPK